jgi:hypothetical protein
LDSSGIEARGEEEIAVGGVDGFVGGKKKAGMEES